MAATTSISVWHGATGSPAASAFPAGGRYHNADTTPTDDASTVSPVVPDSGEVFSWPKFFKLLISGTPSGKISNLRVYTSGVAWATGLKMYGKKTATYAQATSADQTTKIASGVDMTTYTEGSPLTITAGDVIANPNTGYGTQDYLVQQVGISSNASPGLSSGFTSTYKWDET